MVGGDALTVSVVLSRLGVRSALVGRVGKDMNGRFLLEELHRNQVDVKDVIQVEGRHTAVSYILIEPDGERHFLVENSINQTLRSRDILGCGNQRSGHGVLWQRACHAGNDG
ncbi:MAG: carbohydrate kinase family protein [[Clostridium] scindens]